MTQWDPSSYNQGCSQGHGMGLLLIIRGAQQDIGQRIWVLTQTFPLPIPSNMPWPNPQQENKLLCILNFIQCHRVKQNLKSVVTYDCWYNSSFPTLTNCISWSECSFKIQICFWILRFKGGHKRNRKQRQSSSLRRNLYVKIKIQLTNWSLASGIASRGRSITMCRKMMLRNQNP